LGWINLHHASGDEHRSLPPQYGRQASTADRNTSLHETSLRPHISGFDLRKMTAFIGCGDRMIAARVEAQMYLCCNSKV